jgi:hypothetical protein
LLHGKPQILQGLTFSLTLDNVCKVYNLHTLPLISKFVYPLCQHFLSSRFTLLPSFPTTSKDFTEVSTKTRRPEKTSKHLKRVVVRDARFFVVQTYQNGKNILGKGPKTAYTKRPYIIPNGRKYPNIFHSKAIQNRPTLGFWFFLN